MPCPYNIILGRDTALPSPLYHSGVTGIDITYSTFPDTNGSNKLRSSMGSSSKTRLSPFVSL